MSLDVPIPLGSLVPDGLVVPAGGQWVTGPDACDGLAHALLNQGYAVLQADEPLELGGASAALNVFFGRPSQEKEALRPPQPHEGVGYRALIDDRELIERRAGPWLSAQPPLPQLSAASQELGPLARSALDALLRSSVVRLPGAALAAVLDGLSQPPDSWAPSSLQCFRYGAGSSGCEAHEDRSLLTLIYAPHQPGLQVLGRGASEWRAVELDSKQLLVLAGYALEHMTCGLVRSSQHRIVLGGGTERYSLVYKLAAQSGAVIHLAPALQAAGHSLSPAADRYPQPVTFGQIMAHFHATHRTANPSAQPVAAASDAAVPEGEASGGPAAVAGAVEGEGGSTVASNAAAGSERAPKRAREDSPPPPPRRAAERLAVPDRLTIRIKGGPPEREFVCLVKRSTQWHRVARAYCSRFELDPAETKFLYDGQLCRNWNTIEELDMEGGDVACGRLKCRRWHSIPNAVHLVSELPSLLFPTKQRNCILCRAVAPPPPPTRCTPNPNPITSPFHPFSPPHLLPAPHLLSFMAGLWNPIPAALHQASEPPAVLFLPCTMGRRAGVLGVVRANAGQH